MNKSLLVIALAITTILSLILCPDAVMAHTTEAASAGYKAPVPKVTKQIIVDRLNNLSSEIDLRYTEEVGRRVKEYTVSYRVAGEKILGRVGMYFPLFEQQIQERNLPEELKYVAVVESHLDITARSKSGAVGLWQFIKSTAEMQGLTVNKYLDERKDAVLSTDAALDYLESLYEQFGDWTLAIAAYNCGPGGVRKAMRRSGKSDFWSIRNYLPRETQKYLPRIIAAMYLMKYYHMHDLHPQRVDADLTEVTMIKDGKGHNLDKLSQQLGLNKAILKRLNSKYITGLFPKNEGHLELSIPSSSYNRYLELHSPESYKQVLVIQREEELIALRKKIVSAREHITNLHFIQSIVYDRVRQKNRKPKIYKVKV